MTNVNDSYNIGDIFFNKIKNDVDFYLVIGKYGKSTVELKKLQYFLKKEIKNMFFKKYYFPKLDVSKNDYFNVKVVSKGKNKGNLNINDTHLYKWNKDTGSVIMIIPSKNDLE